MKSAHARWGEVALAATGVFLAVATFRSYKTFGGMAPPPTLAKPLPSLEADARIQSLQAYLKDHPDDFRALIDLAVTCYQKGPAAYIEGLNALDKAKRLGATGENLFYYGGVMYQGVGLPEHASAELEKYLRHYPEDLDTRVRLANLYLQLKRLDDSWALYQELRHERGQDPVILYNYAVVAKEKKLWPEATDAVQALKGLTTPLPPELNVLALEGEIQKGMTGKK